jgi:hypothetical protein
VIKKIAGWAAFVFLVWFVVKNPAGAAHTARAIGAGLSHAAGGLGDFFIRLAT